MIINLSPKLLVLMLFIASLLSVIRAESTEPIKLGQPPVERAEFFAPPEKYRDDFGQFRSPLTFADGSRVQNAADWPRRRPKSFRPGKE
jgi:hypothetical protein